MTNLLSLLCFFIKILVHANGSNAKTKRKILKRLNDFKFYIFYLSFSSDIIGDDAGHFQTSVTSTNA